MPKYALLSAPIGAYMITVGHYIVTPAVYYAVMVVARIVKIYILV
jgi:hypothetical protein